MTIDQFREIRAKAGGLILLLPENFSELSTEEKQVCNSIIIFNPIWDIYKLCDMTLILLKKKKTFM